MSCRIFSLLMLAVLCCLDAAGATFGKVVTIGGHASDVAFDRRRNVVYIANYTGSRIDVLSAADNTLRQPIRTAPVPYSISLSPDGRYLVVVHGIPPNAYQSLTILDLDAQSRNDLWLPATPLTVSFGNGNRAFIVTTKGMYLLDPATTILEYLPGPNLECEAAPVKWATFPTQIQRATAGVSGNGDMVVVMAQFPTGDKAGCTVTDSAPQDPDQTMIIRYCAACGGKVLSVSGFTTSPPEGPRVVSVNRDGSTILFGWGLIDSQDVLLAQFPYGNGAYEKGGHAFDHYRNLIYAQVPPSAEDKDEPVLHVMDTDNLTVRERLRIPENLAGKGVFSPDMNTLYAISDSGVTVFSVGSLAAARRVAAAEEQLLFESNSCDNLPVTQTLHIVDRGGGQTGFALSVPNGVQGVEFSQVSGTTPADVQVRVSPSLLASASGTATIPINIVSADSILIAPQVRVLVNKKDPDQRGSVLPVAGKIVDVLSDKARNRIYVLRQDQNQVIVLDATSFRQVATLRTANTPMQMTIAYGKNLLVSADNSQIATMYDLDSLKPMRHIVFPGGHYPRSIAASNSAILAVARNVGKYPCTQPGDPKALGEAPAMLDRVDLFTFRAAPQYAPPTCAGIYVNNVPIDTVLMPSATGRMIFGASVDGNVMLYEDGYDTYVASRKDVPLLGGSMLPISDDLFMAGGLLFSRSLTQRGPVVPDGGGVDGLLPGGDAVMVVSANSASESGLVRTVMLDGGKIMKPVRSIEAPVTPAMLTTPPVGQIGQTIPAFLRTMAATNDGAVYLSVSGLTKLPRGFDEARDIPVISQAGNLANGGDIAPGSLMRIYGSHLSMGAQSAGSVPLPKSLAEVCVTVNGMAMPLIGVMPDHIEGQMPFEVSGNATLVVTSPGGKSIPYAVSVPATAPAIFRSGQAGDRTDIPLVYRAVNNDLVTFSNPVHPKDVLVIIATGLGHTANEPESGAGAPMEPLPTALVTPTITVGGTPLKVVYAGLIPGQVGVYQINAEVPYNIPNGVQSTLTMTQGSSSMTMPVRVVNP